jgi:hypothetical protein
MSVDGLLARLRLLAEFWESDVSANRTVARHHVMDSKWSAAERCTAIADTAQSHAARLREIVAEASVESGVAEGRVCRGRPRHRLVILLGPVWANDSGERQRTETDEQGDVDELVDKGHGPSGSLGSEVVGDD